ncbi:HAD-IC family P-type ATPase, partial [Ruminococcaceae bacterium OttesenSCG-928-D13]|nr:HAD-IC family P-type ATPase [Ruminococcaceae bacterium OttesenSCG-928-D13]
MEKNLQPPKNASNYPFERLTPDPAIGLSEAQVRVRMENSAHNAPPAGVTASVGKIILKNVITPFNIINLLLALAVTLVGHPRNALFFFIAVINTLMGIFQELRAKRTLDKLSILARGKVAVVRDGQRLAVPQEEVVLDDIVLLEAGGQASADAVLVAGEGLEMDESLLTGESDAIRKNPGDAVFSGSFVAAGHGTVRVTAVGGQSYAGQLSVQAKQEKKQTAPLMRTLNTIIKVLGIAIVPVGLLLFYTQYTSSGDLVASVLGATAAMVGMIPEGLILLTGVTLTLGAMKLARRKALVQALPSIETLARADVLCLDKTGTITDGTLSFEEIVPFEGAAEADIRTALAEMMAALHDDNATAHALRAAFPAGGQWQSVGTVPFSSARKWSAAAFAEKGSYVLGAPGFVFPGGMDFMAEQITSYAEKGFRVLCLARSEAPLPDGALPAGLKCLALVVLSDTVRAEAPDTFCFFESEGVTLKVISGDDALTVSTIAQKAGITGAERYIDLSAAPAGADYAFLAERYTVFGRVTPEQKKALVAALKGAGHTVCMTGDGVNDVLAMKESDCGVAMITGSEAARGASDFVLMTGDFSAMVDVLKEGRRVINNIENVASMYLVKTIYSTILSFLYVFIPYPYPFTTLQMTPINSLTVGIPSFFLALRPDYQKPQGRFLMNILENSVPAALSVVFNIIVIQLAGIAFDLSFTETATMNVLLAGAVSFRLLAHVARPLKWPEITLISVLIAAFLGAFLLFGDFLTL